MHPDQVAAAARSPSASARALGTEVRVRPRGTGYKVELTVEAGDEAVALAARIAAGA